MPLEVRADFILGFYKGHKMGEPEDVPSPERLHAALLAGACGLERLEGKHPEKVLDRQDLELFAWLEKNAPDAIVLPEIVSSGSNARSSWPIAFRNKGEIKKRKIDTNKPCFAMERTYLDGPIAWYWEDCPNDMITKRLRDVAQEVPYLGGSESRVALEVRSVISIPQEALRRCRISPSLDARAFRVPREGYTEELQKSFNSHEGGKEEEGGRREQDVLGDNEKEKTRHCTFNCVSYICYAKEAARVDVPNVPWTSGYALRVENRRLTREEYVRCSVGLHRALASQFGDALPKVMQRASALPLANGLAIQVIAAGMPACALTPDDGHDHLLVMLPKNAPAGEEAQVVRALSKITFLNAGKSGRLDVTFLGERLDLAHFWSPQRQGARRLFTTEPLFISDCRPPKRGRGTDAGWTVDDDARVAFAHVWRDQGFVTVTRGDRGREELSRMVADAGVAVGGGRVVPLADARDFVHHTNRGTMLVGEWATIDMGSLGRDECVCAIGQTRHLGGGLLVPVDIPKMRSNRPRGEGGHDDGD
jgi:CRISPR-associated protein Csb2